MNTGGDNARDVLAALCRGSVAAPIALLIAAIALPFLLNGYHVFIFSMAFAYVVAAVGFDMALGRAGLLAFTGAAFFGLGAFVAGRLATLGVPTELTLVAAFLAGAVLGFLYGAVTVRLQAYYFAITGIVLMLLLNFFYRNAEAIAGGYSGFSIPPPSFMLAGGPLRSTTAMYFVGLGLAVPAFVAARLIGRSRIGRSWRVVREAPAVAEGLGINVWQARLLAIVLSSAYLALGGAWFGYLSLRFLPESFMFEQLLLLFLMLIIGGLRSVTGAAIGAVILIWFNQYLAEFVGVSDIIYGISLLACVLLFSRGIYGTLSNKFRGFRESLL